MTAIDTTPDRRALRKQRTREAIHAAALELFASRGFEAVTVRDIADAAEIAPRTFFLHYSSKEDVLIGDVDERAATFLQALAGRPAEETAFEALRAALEEFYAQAAYSDSELRLRVRLVEETPSLRARNLEQYDEIADAIAVEMGRRSGTDPSRDVYPRVLASAGMQALALAASIWHRRGTEGEFLDVVAEVFEQLAGGLVAPTQQGRG